MNKDEKVIQAFRNIVKALPAAVRRLAADQIALVAKALGDDGLPLGPKPKAPRY